MNDSLPCLQCAEFDEHRPGKDTMKTSLESSAREIKKFKNTFLLQFYTSPKLVLIGSNTREENFNV